jgi:hypothetical protein
MRTVCTLYACEPVLIETFIGDSSTLKMRTLEGLQTSNSCLSLNNVLLNTEGKPSNLNFLPLVPVLSIFSLQLV